MLLFYILENYKSHVCEISLTHRNSWPCTSATRNSQIRTPVMLVLLIIGN